MKHKFAPGTTKLILPGDGEPISVDPDRWKETYRQRYDRETCGLQWAAARRYSLAREMRDLWLRDRDPYWLQCYEIDMHAAGSMSASARRRMGVDSL